MIVADLAVVRAAMIGRDHPVEAETARHHSIHRNWIDRIAANVRCRGRRLIIPSSAESAMDVVISG